MLNYSAAGVDEGEGIVGFTCKLLSTRNDAILMIPRSLIGRPPCTEKPSLQLMTWIIIWSTASYRITLDPPWFDLANRDKQGNAQKVLKMIVADYLSISLAQDSSQVIVFQGLAARLG